VENMEEKPGQEKRPCCKMRGREESRDLGRKKETIPSQMESSKRSDKERKQGKEGNEGKEICSEKLSVGPYRQESHASLRRKPIDGQIRPSNPLLFQKSFIREKRREWGGQRRKAQWGGTYNSPFARARNQNLGGAYKGSNTSLKTGDKTASQKGSGEKGEGCPNNGILKSD